ncbi:lysis protein [Noviherbaspirillum cavernae]|uniref:Lysis protein n=1 Tax=Noviherbaspirillum cavernae TaxID=2320862 RepID=A0A418X1B9_9BURK|nr:lysis system i-spanin subunit Rz [Noviherbaspirillum cavernae]RJG06236.1 lysis protein [Noviherbaspirillum cavernae]
MNALAPYIGFIRAAAFIAAALFIFKMGGDSVRAQWAAADRERVEAAADLARETRRAFDAITVNSQKEKENANATIASLRADMRNGTERLSLAVAACQTGTSGAGNSEARAELLPAAADRIVGIIGEADDAVRDLNACIDKYNAVKGTL